MKINGKRVTAGNPLIALQRHPSIRHIRIGTKRHKRCRIDDRIEHRPSQNKRHAHISRHSFPNMPAHHRNKSAFADGKKQPQHAGKQHSGNRMTRHPPLNCSFRDENLQHEDSTTPSKTKGIASSTMLIKTVLKVCNSAAIIQEGMENRWSMNTKGR